MRRRSVGVRQADEFFGKDLEAALSVDPALAIRVLEPLVTERRRARLRRIVDERLDSVTVLMDAPHDPHNGGAVVRSCDAFGVQRLHVVERCESFLVASTVARGTEQWVDVHRYRSAGDVLEKADTLMTGADGRVGLTFIDNSRLSLGPNSQMTLEKFTFNPTTQEGAFLTKLYRGTLAVISGHIAHSAQDAMQVQTRTTILGVRGTSFLVQIKE